MTQVARDQTHSLLKRPALKLFHIVNIARGAPGLDPVKHWPPVRSLWLNRFHALKAAIAKGDLASIDGNDDQMRSRVELDPLLNFAAQHAQDSDYDWLNSFCSTWAKARGLAPGEVRDQETAEDSFRAQALAIKDRRGPKRPYFSRLVIFLRFLEEKQEVNLDLELLVSLTDKFRYRAKADEFKIPRSRSALEAAIRDAIVVIRAGV